jgi:D-3-phosphoglycerate dehydrogenase
VPLEASLGEQLQMLSSCHGYYVMAARDELPQPLHVHRELLSKLPNLLMAASYGAGYDPLDPEACTEAGVALVNQAGGNAQGVAEHAVGMMLACLKRMPEAHAAMKAGHAQDRAALMGARAAGALRRPHRLRPCGQRVAVILRTGFGCRVIVTDPLVDAVLLAGLGIEKVGLDALLREADVISLHCPLAPSTRGMIGAAQFAAMKRGAVFVTTARGSIHDEAALLAALDSGQIASAGLDVWEVEPPPVDHPLLHHPAVLASQHTAGVTQESRANITRIAAWPSATWRPGGCRRASSIRRWCRASPRGSGRRWASTWGADGPASAQLHQGQLRRHAEAHRQDGGAQPAGDDQLPPPLAHMAQRVAVAEARRHVRRPAEQPHLAAMGMARQGEGDALGNSRKDVRLVRQQDGRRVVGQLGQGAGQVVGAAGGERRPGCPGQRSRSPPDGAPPGSAGGDAGGGEGAQPFRRGGAGGGRRVVPPVMIAGDGVAAERRAQPCQDRRDLGWRGEARDPAMVEP